MADDKRDIQEQLGHCPSVMDKVAAFFDRHPRTTSALEALVTLVLPIVCVVSITWLGLVGGVFTALVLYWSLRSMFSAHKRCNFIVRIYRNILAGERVVGDSRLARIDFLERLVASMGEDLRRCQDEGLCQHITPMKRSKWKH